MRLVLFVYPEKYTPLWVRHLGYLGPSCIIAHWLCVTYKSNFLVEVS